MGAGWLGCTTLGITNHGLHALGIVPPSYSTLMWKCVKWKKFLVRRNDMHGHPEMQHGGSEELKDAQYGKT